MEESLKKWFKQFKESESSASFVLGAIVVVVVGILIFNFIKGNNQSQVSETGESTDSATIDFTNFESENLLTNLPSKHTVSPNEHLWGIAQKYYGSGYNFIDIESANQELLKNGLKAGMEIIIPKVNVRKPTTSIPTVAVKETQVTTTTSIQGSSYQVIKGDNLWNIATRAYGDGYKWVSIYQANMQLIKNPNLIYIGINLSLPR